MELVLMDDPNPEPEPAAAELMAAKSRTKSKELKIELPPVPVPRNANRSRSREHKDTTGLLIPPPSPFKEAWPGGVDDTESSMVPPLAARRADEAASDEEQEEQEETQRLEQLAVARASSVHVLEQLVAHAAVFPVCEAPSILMQVHAYVDRPDFTLQNDLHVALEMVTKAMCRSATQQLPTERQQALNANAALVCSSERTMAWLADDGACGLYLPNSSPEVAMATLWSH